MRVLVGFLDAWLLSLEVIPMAAQVAKAPTYDLPEKDRPIMTAAIRGGCDVLLTGDKTHFGHLYGTRVEGLQAFSPAQFAERLPAQDRQIR